MSKEQKILLLFVLLAIGGGVAFYVTKQDTSLPVSQTQSETPVVSNEAAPAPVANTSDTPKTSDVPVAVSNKTYTETLSYQAPENHTEEITVTVVVDAKGSIVDVTFANAQASNRESKQYLSRFASTFSPSMVVGKSVHSVNLSRVGGASLTTNAFNKAVANIGAKING